MFLIKALVVSFPFLLLFCIYIISDPFRVLYRYKNYYFPRERQYITLNRDRITTETLIRNYPVYHYDSYIFGNSRSYFYRTADWSKLIGSSHCFHYNANDESLYGIVQKLKYLDQHHYTFRNALFVFDIGLLKQSSPNKGHLFIKHPVYTRQPWMEYQAEFLKAFFDPRFLVAYLDLRITGKFKGYMKKVLNDKIYDYEFVHNELFLNDEEQKIKADSANYYQKKKKIFYERSKVQEMIPPVIKTDQKILLKEMAELLQKQSVDFRLIVSPLYDQKKLNEEDTKYLKELFGSAKVFDFSGKNEMTDPIGHYYENSHYRPYIATQIMEFTYRHRVNLISQ